MSLYITSKTGIESREAAILLHKRLALSLSPLLFAFLGATLGMRVRKGGRGIGILLSVLAMLFYYLIMLGGEQIARAGTVAPFVGAWLASLVTLVCAFILMVAGRGDILWRRTGIVRKERAMVVAGKLEESSSGDARARFLSFPSLMDMDVLYKVTLNFIVSFISLLAIFLIFTLFELWRFVITKGIGLEMVGEYLLFLLPLVIVQLLPASVLIAMLVTYALIAKHNEAVAWWSGGQSVYRLMLPGLMFAIVVASGLWIVQEQLMPQANVRQDMLRTNIRGGVSRATVGYDRQWLASAETGRLYSYEHEEADTLRNLVIYDFDSGSVHLGRILTARSASWQDSGSSVELRDTVSLSLQKAEAGWSKGHEAELEVTEAREVFKPAIDKPSHLSASILSDHIKSVKKRGEDAAILEIALQKKYTGPFNVMVMALIGMPLALTFGRKSTIIALCIAIALGLIFWAAIGGFQQMGEYGLLPPVVAAWSPIVIFAASGIYLLFRART